MVYNMSCENNFEILASNLFADHVPGTLPSLSNFLYLDSTHFSENFGMSYMVVSILLPQYKAFSIFPKFLFSIYQVFGERISVERCSCL